MDIKNQEQIVTLLYQVIDLIKLENPDPAIDLINNPEKKSEKSLGKLALEMTRKQQNL